MKFLKIENNKGFYRVDMETEVWIEIDQIGKDHLLQLLKFAMLEDFEIEEYKDELLQNPAHNIIYKNIYGKLFDLNGNRTRFSDSVEAMYRPALEKYRSSVQE